MLLVIIKGSDNQTELLQVALFRVLGQAIRKRENALAVCMVQFYSIKVTKLGAMFAPCSLQTQTQQRQAPPEEGTHPAVNLQSTQAPQALQSLFSSKRSNPSTPPAAMVRDIQHCSFFGYSLRNETNNPE